MSTDPRAELAGALARMKEASDALAAKVSDEAIRHYTDACNDARAAFEKVVLAGYERAKRLLKERRP